MAEQKTNGKIKKALKKVAVMIKETASKIFLGKSTTAADEEHIAKKQRELEAKISALKGMVKEAGEPAQAMEQKRRHHELEIGIIADFETRKPKMPAMEKAQEEKISAAAPEEKPQVEISPQPAISEITEEAQEPKIGIMLDSMKKKEEKELQKALRRKSGARKAAKTRKKKHEEIVERLEKIAERIGTTPRARKHRMEKSIAKKLGNIEKKLSARKKKNAHISWEAGKQIVSTLKKIERKTKPIEGKVLQVPKSTNVSKLSISQEPAAAQKAGVQETKIAEERELEEASKLSIEEQVELAKRMINRVRYEFYKRIISEEEFKKRTSNLEQKIRMLEEKKKILSERKVVPEKAKVIVQKAAEAQKQMREPEVKIETMEAMQAKVDAVKGRTRLEKAVEEKAAGQIPQEKIKNLELRLQELASKYNIPKSEIAQDIEKLSAGQILQDFDKLISLIEHEHAEKTAFRADTMKFEPIPAHIAQRHKAERGKAVEMEIEKQTLETDFDKIANYIKEKGTATATQVAKDLKLTLRIVRESSKILEQNGLLLIEYPTIGDIRIKDIEYARNHKQELQKAKESAALEKQQRPKKAGFFKMRLFGAKKETQEEGASNAGKSP